MRFQVQNRVELLVTVVNRDKTEAACTLWWLCEVTHLAFKKQVADRHERNDLSFLFLSMD